MAQRRRWERLAARQHERRTRECPCAHLPTATDKFCAECGQKLVAPDSPEDDRHALFAYLRDFKNRPRDGDADTNELTKAAMLDALTIAERHGYPPDDSDTIGRIAHARLVTRIHWKTRAAIVADLAKTPPAERDIEPEQIIGMYERYLTPLTCRVFTLRRVPRFAYLIGIYGADPASRRLVIDFDRDIRLKLTLEDGREFDKGALVWTIAKEGGAKVYRIERVVPIVTDWLAFMLCVWSPTDYSQQLLAWDAGPFEVTRLERTLDEPRRRILRKEIGHEKARERRAGAMANRSEDDQRDVIRGANEISRTAYASGRVPLRGVFQAGHPPILDGAAIYPSENKLFFDTIDDLLGAHDSEAWRIESGGEGKYLLGDNQRPQEDAEPKNLIEEAVEDILRRSEANDPDADFRRLLAKLEVNALAKLLPEGEMRAAFILHRKCLDEGLSDEEGCRRAARPPGAHRQALSEAYKLLRNQSK